MARNNRQPRRNNHRSSVKLSQRPEDGLEAFMDASVDAFLLFDENLDLLNINYAGERMLGISKEVVEGKNILDFAPEIKKTGRYNKYLDVLGTGDPFFAEDIFPHSRFGDMHLSVKAFKMRKGLGMIVNDITERKRIEKALKLSERYFRALTENASDGVAVVSGEGTISYESPSFNRMLGYEMEEWKGKSSFELVHPDDLSKAVDLFTELIQNPSDIVKAEIRGKHKDGSWRTLEVVGRNLLSDPAVDGIVANFRDITERRQMEESLRESELLATATIEGMSDGVMLVGIDGKVTYVNRAFEKLLGHKAEEIVGTSALELPTYRDSKDREKAREALRMLIEKGSTKAVDMTAITKDGEEIPISFNASVIKDAQGSPKMLVAVLRDVTERRWAEEVLRQSEEYFRALIENSQDAIVILDSDGTIRYESPSTARLWGYKPEDWADRNYWEFVFPEDMQDVAEKFAKLLQNQGTSLFTNMRVRQKDGSMRVVEASGQNLLDNPAVKGIVLNIRDITERKQAEEALRESEKRLRDIVENSREWIWEVDTKGKYTYSSPIVESIAGYTPEEILEKHFYDLFHPDDRESLKQGAFETFARKEPFREFVNRNVSKDGKTIWLSTSGIPILDNAGNLMGYRGSDVDITERKQAEEALRRSEEYFRSLIENAQDAMVIVAGDGTISYGSPSIERMLGYKPEELISADALFGFAHPDDIPKVVDTFTNFTEKGNVSGRIELRIRHKDGSWRVVEAVANNLLENQVIKGIVVNWRDVTERKRAEESLKESEERYRRLVDNAQDIIFRFSADKGLEYVSPAVTKITGYTPEELRADPKLGFGLATAKDERLSVDYEKVMTQGLSLRTRDLTAVSRDGRQIYLDMRSQAVRDKDGNVVAFEGILRDVTESRKTEEEKRKMAEELAQSEAKYRSLIETAGAGVAAINLKGEFVLVNEALCNMIGYSQEELLGKNFADFLHPHDVAALLDLFSRGLEGSKDNPNIEFRVIHKDGHDIWCYSSPTPLVNQNETVGFNAIIYDITQRKQAEEALRESEEKLRLIFESITDGIVVTDSNGVIIEANEGAAQIGRFGSKEAMLGKSAFELIAPLDHERAAMNMQKTMEQKSVMNLEYTLIRADGSEYPGELNVAVLKDASGNPVGFVGIVRDITERKRMEEEVRRLSDAVKMTSESVAIADLKGKIVDINEAGLRMYGLDDRQIS